MAPTQKQSTPTLFNDPVLSDVKLLQIYDGKTREYYAHKAILCSQSSYFLNIFTGGFKEASEDTIKLHDDDPDHFEFALKYVYTLKSKTNEIEFEDEMDDDLERMQLMMGVYTIADKYDIERLISPVKAKFKKVFGKTKDHEALCSVIKTHYTSFASPGHCIGNIIASSLLDTHHDFTHDGPFQTFYREFPILAVDIIDSMSRVQCGSCGSTNFIGRAREWDRSFKCTYCYNKDLGSLLNELSD